MIQVGFLGVRHVHAPAYVAALQGLATLGPVHEPDQAASKGFGLNEGTLDEVVNTCDAVIVAGTNVEHAPMARAALAAGKHVLCEKPLVTNESDGTMLVELARKHGCVLMTAFPCPYSPAFIKLQSKLKDIGELRAICATNRGQCPGGWFVDPAQSGGGAIVDHTVHLADLLWRIIGEEPESVYVSSNNLMHENEVEDCAILTLRYKNGVFATIDASWSRPTAYKTWGDVTMNVVGDGGVLEANLFIQSLDVTTDQHRQAEYGSNLDRLMVQEFLAAIAEKREPLTSGEDGLRACRVAWAAQRSAASGQAELVSGS